MTAIRGWNGTAWTAPKYRASGSWKPYAQAYTPPAPNFHVGLEEAHIHNGAADYAAWGFDGDAQGWTANSSYGTEVVNWSPGRLDWYPIAGNNAYSAYYYSPGITGLNQGDPIGGWIIATLFSVNDGFKPGTFGISVNLYGNGLVADSARHVWNYVGEQVRIDIPVFLREGYMVPNFQIYNYGTKASATSAFIPQYWNGSAWVPQTEV